MTQAVQKAPRRRLVIFIASLGFYTLLLAWGQARGVPDVLQAWQGYYTLVVSQEVSPDLVREALEIENLEGVGEDDLLFDLGTWAGIERVSPAAFEKGLRADDPRWTPWFAKAARLFRDEGGGYRLWYVPWTGSLETLKARIQGHAATWQAEWGLLEENSTEGKLLRILVWTLAGLLLVLGPDFRWSLLAGLIPWAVLASSLGPGMLVFMFLSLAVFHVVNRSIIPVLRHFVNDEGPEHFFWELVHEPRKALQALKELWRYGKTHAFGPWLATYLAGTLGAIIAGAGTGDTRVVPSLIALFWLVWPSIWIWSAYLLSWRRNRQEHTLFHPVPILSTTNRQPRRVLAGVSLLLVASLAGAFFFLQNRGRGELSPVRVPTPLSAESGSVLELGNLHGPGRGDQELPQTREILEHRVLMELWGIRPANRPLDLGLPELGYRIETLEVQSGGGDGPAQVRKTTLFSFDQAWLNDWSRAVAPRSPEGLILSQGNPILAYTSGHGVYSLGTGSLWGLVGIIVFWALVLASFRRGPRLSGQDTRRSWRTP